MKYIYCFLFAFLFCLNLNAQDFLNSNDKSKWWGRLEQSWQELLLKQVDVLQNEGNNYNLNDSILEVLFEKKSLSIDGRDEYIVESVPDFSLFKNLKKIEIKRLKIKSLQSLEKLKKSKKINIVLTENIFRVPVDSFFYHKPLRLDIWWSNLSEEWRVYYLNLLSRTDIRNQDIVTILNKESITILKEDKVSDLRGLTNLSYLKNVKIIGQEIKSIEGIFWMPETVNWNCENNQFKLKARDFASLTEKSTLNINNVNYKGVDLWWSNLSSRWKTIINEAINDSTNQRNYCSTINCKRINLVKLNLDGSKYGKEELDLTPLTNLTNLRSLRIRNFSKLENLNILKEHQLLRLLDCSDNQLCSLDGIEKTLENLFVLDCSRNRLKSIDNLRKGTKINILLSEDNIIESLSPLLYHANCEMLMVGGNKIRSLDGIQYMTKLKQLRLSDNPIKDFESLGNKYNSLERLYCERIDLATLNILSYFPNLQVFNFAGNKVSSLNGLRNCLKLRSLVFNNNRIEHLGEVNVLENLQVLECSNNYIDNIDVVLRLKHIQILSATKNRINLIEVTNDFSSIEELWISKNKISDFLFLKKMPYLKVFSASDNKIDIHESVIDGINSLDKIEEFYLYKSDMNDDLIRSMHNVLDQKQSLRIKCIPIIN
jgi:protein phosphatase 1 regulatory subunit 7